MTLAHDREMYSPLVRVALWSQRIAKERTETGMSAVHVALLFVVAQFQGMNEASEAAQGTLARAAGTCERAARSALGELVSHGWLARREVTTPRGREVRYSITLERGTPIPRGVRHLVPEGGVRHLVPTKRTSTGGAAPNAPSGLPQIAGASGLGGDPDADLDAIFGAAPGERGASSPGEATSGESFLGGPGAASPPPKPLPRNDNASAKATAAETPRATAGKKKTQKPTNATRSGVAPQARRGGTPSSASDACAGEAVTEDERRIHHALLACGFGDTLATPGSFDAGDPFVWQLAALVDAGRPVERVLLAVKTAGQHRAGKGSSRGQAGDWLRASEGGRADVQRLIQGYARAERRFPGRFDLTWERGALGTPDRIGAALAEAAAKLPPGEDEIARSIVAGLRAPRDGQLPMAIAWIDRPWLAVLAAFARGAGLTPDAARERAADAAHQVDPDLGRTKGRRSVETALSREYDPASRRTVAKVARASQTDSRKTA